MEATELKKLLSKRLYLELQLFKDSKLMQEKEEIYQSSYEIEVYLNLYEVLAAQLDSLREEVLRRLLSFRFGILKSLYQEWLARADCLAREDRLYEELRAYICSDLEEFLEV
ncbi:MAG: hypothetical protein NC432_14285 [Roseburia sp.]|nr:hypothetical protein [Roseburia sp.]MCM1099342.1 hypothetical protein [Ruminococcus flavefaciens]